MAAAFTPQSLSTSSLLPQSTPSSTPKPTILQPFQQQAAFAHFQGLRSSSSSSFSSAARAKKVGFTPCPTSKGEPPRGVILCSANRMNLVFVSAEVAPWSKTGGLGDVISGLPSALAARGHRVMTVAPRYDQYIDGWDTSIVIQVKVGDKMEEVRFFHCFKDGVDRVFVDHPLFLAKVLGKTGVKIYGAEFGEDYEDNKLRFSLLCQAALEAPRVLNLSNNPYFSGPYGEDVMFIANDWHSALLPCYLQAFYKPFGLYKNAKVAYCIHNVAYQGLFPFTEFPLLNLPGKFKSSFDFMEWRNEPVGRKINWMKAGILESDMVLTVSPNYACELLSEPDRGAGLNAIVRKTGITGIVNGMDVQEWDPSTDKYLEVKYDISTVFEAKPAMKEALQAEVGLPVDSRIPVFAFIGRLDEQKGSDILVEALPEILEQNIQLILLGTGKKYLEKQLAELEIKYPKKARGVPNFSARFGHILTAGADFMLIPSRFEPCGLIQLHAMRYGTVPVVASTGGLVDTVKDGVTGFHLGRAFTTVGKGMDSSDVKSLAAVVKRALCIYGTSQFERMVKACMDQDFSWKRPAKIWENALLDLQNRPEAEEEEPTPFVLEKVAIS